jgi:hypothetical protein
MEDDSNEPKSKRFRYAYVFEYLFGIIICGLCALIAFLDDPLYMFVAWWILFVSGIVVIFFLKRRMERELSEYLGDEKMKLIYTIGVYWFEGGLFIAAVLGTLFFIVLKATGKL